MDLPTATSAFARSTAAPLGAAIAALSATPARAATGADLHGCATSVVNALGLVATTSHDGTCAGLHTVGIGLLVVAALLVLSLARLRMRTEQRRLDLARQFLEQGREPPAALLRGVVLADRRRGLVLIFGGLGLAASALVTGAHDLSSGALVPIFIGVGYLVSYRIGAAEERSRS